MMSEGVPIRDVSQPIGEQGGIAKPPGGRPLGPHPEDPGIGRGTGRFGFGGAVGRGTGDNLNERSIIQASTGRDSSQAPKEPGRPPKETQGSHKESSAVVPEKGEVFAADSSRLPTEPQQTQNPREKEERTVETRRAENRAATGGDSPRPPKEPGRPPKETQGSRFIKQEDLLAPSVPPSKKPMIQEKALRERPVKYPERSPIAPGTTWETLDRSQYHPEDYTSAAILAGEWNPDPVDPHAVEGYPEFPSYEGAVSLDDDGRPLNSMGPTGLRGRGELSKWGANFAADPIVTRVSDGVLEMIAVQRTDSEEWAIPGGGVEKGERATQALQRELGEETAADLNFEAARPVYRGGVDDRRNTDNAWMETEAYHLHLERDTDIEFRPQPGETLAVRWMPVTEREVDALFASHAHFVRLAVQDFEQQTGLVVDKEGRVGRLVQVDVRDQKS